MDNQFWLDKWEQQQTGFHLDEAHPLLTRYWPTLGLPAGGRVFVPLCGKSHDLAYLRQQGHEVIGVELSPLAIEQFFDERQWTPERLLLQGFPFLEAEGIRIIQGDYFRLLPEMVDEIDVVYDRAALIAMPPERQSDYAAQLISLAGERASILLITLEYDQREMSGPPFSTPPHQVKTLFSDRYRIDRLESQAVLEENPALRERGLSALSETLWRLVPR